mmetsp:Transcript_3002/g.10021  ORF Transcript_3002/g.10021 Transcript_3002/m.10021 type:complete len:233 (+) Transcript_3002:63-761(+)
MEYHYLAGSCGRIKHACVFPQAPRPGSLSSDERCWCSLLCAFQSSTRLCASPSAVRSAAPSSASAASLPHTAFRRARASPLSASSSPSSPSSPSTSTCSAASEASAEEALRWTHSTASAASTSSKSTRAREEDRPPSATPAESVLRSSASSRSPTGTASPASALLGLQSGAAAGGPASPLPIRERLARLRLTSWPPSPRSWYRCFSSNHDTTSPRVPLSARPASEASPCTST